MASNVDIATMVKRLRPQIQDDLTLRIPTETQYNDRSATERAIADAVDMRTKHMQGLSQEDKKKIRRAVLDDFLNYGPIQALLDDEAVTEVMVNGHDEVYVEVSGRIKRVDANMFSSDEEVIRLIDRILQPLNRRCDEGQPFVDARLPDGSRVNATIPPISLNGPCLTIRKFSHRRLDGDDLISVGAASPQMMEFLAASVEARCNIMVSGGTSSGKTTLLNVLSGYIPRGERIITIEDSAELKLSQPHVLRRESRPANSEGTGEVTVHDLLVNALRERPDRIIVGECRSDEAVEMLQAMNTGHDGSMTTIHANSPADSFSRIDYMVGRKGINPEMSHRQIASAIQLVVQTSRFRDGSRKIEQVCAIRGIEGGNVVCLPLFDYKIKGFDEAGKVIGAHVPSGYKPPSKVFTQFELAGLMVDPRWFGGE